MWTGGVWGRVQQHFCTADDYILKGVNFDAHNRAGIFSVVYRSVYLCMCIHARD